MSAPYLGDFIKDDTVRFYWNSFNAAGASITRATNGTVSVYEEGGTTQFTTGVTDTEDFDSLTGVHLCAVVTTDSQYEAGKDYAVVLSAATIDGETVNAVLAHFSIENRSASRFKYHSDGILAMSAASATQVTLTGGSAVDGEYDGKKFFVVAGTGIGQTGHAAAAPHGTTYNGTTKVMVLAYALPTTLSTDSTIIFENDYQGTVTLPTNFDVLGIESDGDLTKVNTLNAHTAQTGDTYAIANGAAGLVAIDTVVDGIQTDLSNGTDGLGALKTLVDAVNTDLSNGTDGLGALKTLIDTLDTVVDAIKAKTDSLTFTVANKVDSNMKTLIDNDLAAGAADNNRNVGY